MIFKRDDIEFYEITNGNDMNFLYRFHFSPDDRVSEDYFFPE